MSFRTRRFQAVPPEQRSWRRRRAVRLVVRSRGEVFLFSDTDPGLPGSQWWVTPGGGIDPGESEREAGVRELFEETGQRVRPDELIGPLAVRTVTHGYSDQITVQDETFFAVDVERFDLVDTNWTDGERVTLQGHAWFAVDDLARHTVWPARLAELCAASGAECLDLGEVEESTVPVTTAPPPDLSESAPVE